MGQYALTGGATGIGAAIKTQLIDDGHSVYVIDIKQADLEADLSSADGRASAVAALQDKFAAGLDGIVTCAGVGSQAPAQLTTSLNYYGSVELVNGVRDLLEKSNGNVILISSNSAPMSTSPEFVEALLDKTEAAALAIAENIDGHQAYSGTKLALGRWMRRNISAFSQQGIRINALAPGYTQTPLTEQVENHPEYGPQIKAFKASIPIGRPGEPGDIAQATKFLLSADASFITGSVLFIDGGHDAMLRPDQF